MVLGPEGVNIACKKKTGCGHSLQNIKSSLLECVFHVLKNYEGRRMGRKVRTILRAYD